nr:MAG TPA: hypothetical protein [Caudoviricetes sp.]
MKVGVATTVPMLFSARLSLRPHEPEDNARRTAC